MKVTEVYAEPASQKDEKPMGGLKMSWNTEGRQLVCRWVDSEKSEKRSQQASSVHPRVQRYRGSAPRV
jgi:hypothetical protein